MYPGVEFDFGGTVKVIPALSLGDVIRLGPKLKAIQGGALDLAEMAPVVVELVHAALTRNYPDMTPEDVGNLVDLQNTKAVIDALMGVSLPAGDAAGKE